MPFKQAEFCDGPLDGETLMIEEGSTAIQFDVWAKLFCDKYGQIHDKEKPEKTKLQATMYRMNGMNLRTMRRVFVWDSKWRNRDLGTKGRPEDRPGTAGTDGPVGVGV
jgi:hypothetical protein